MALDSSRRRDFLILAAERQERERQVGVNIGDKQSVSLSSITAFISAPVPIGTSDFTLEYFGNAYWATSGNSPLIFNNNSRYPYDKGSLLIYGDSKVAVQWVLFEMPSSGAPADDSIFLSAGDRETPFHFVVTRKGTTVKAYFNGELKATKEQSAVKDLGDFRLGMSNGSNMGMSRIYNYALSAEEVAALYNDGDPSGYVLPDAMKGLMPIEVVGNNYYTWTGESDPYFYVAKLSDKLVEGGIYKIVITVANYEKGEPFCKLAPRSTTPIPAANGTYDIYQEVAGEPYDRYLSIYGGNNHTDRRFSITIESIERIGCIAEYVPQNIIICRKRDFPQVTLPIVGYTQSSGVFLVNSASATTQVMNAPQANGFSGKHMRFDAITGISLYCAYWYTYLKKRLPIKITFEYRANRTIYASQQSTAPTAPDAVAIDANEGDAQIASVIYGVGGYAYIFSAADTEAWLEMRVLAIEVVEDICLGWLDSAKQLALNNEYLPPLLETTGGYDLTANGTPEIDYKPTMIVDWSMLVPMSLNGLAVYPGGTVPPAIVNGVLRITSNEKQGSYGGGGHYLNVVNATPGDTVEWDFEIRASGITKVMTCLSVGGRLYYIKVTSTTPEWQRHSYVTPITTNPATDFWISKAYNDTTAGYIEIRNITIKTYRK